MDSNKSTILLVDDEITSLKIGKDILSPYYNVFTMESGRDMLEIVDDVNADLILLDIKMPDMDGYDVIRKLKERPETANIPVIYLTSSEGEETEIKGLSLGAVDYIKKPFNPELLLKRIEMHLLVMKQRNELVAQKNELEDKERHLAEFNASLSQMVSEQTASVTELKNAILVTLAELVEDRDGVTGNHIIRTQQYVKVLFEKIVETGIYEDEIDGLELDMVLQSCQLHDLGKIAISDAILCAPRRLTKEEFDIIKTHTEFGARAIVRIQQKVRDSTFLEYAKTIAVSHHEKWDGSGYPYGLAGKNIPILGRIMAIADVYDALVEERPYKDPFPHEKAVEIILNDKGTHFDPALTDLFASINDQFAKIVKEVNS